MDFRTHYEEFKVQAKDLVEKVHSLVREGNIRRIILKNEDGKTLIEIPLTLGLVGAALLPVYGWLLRARCSGAPLWCWATSDPI